ncbi:MAG: GYD family protein [Chloroflexi bacterium]|nr:MAG: GYD family protein [Chloroflexota bacterium]
MPHFVCLVTFTQQGLSQLSATTKRAEAFKQRAEQLGVKILATYWTLGIYDIVHIIEAPDQRTAASMAFSLGALGNVRTHTLPAFTAEEMRDHILEQVQTPYDLMRNG